MSEAYLTGASHYKDYQTEHFNALVWGMYGTVKGRCDHQHGCEDEARNCAAQIASCLPPQVPLVAKPMWIIRVDDGDFIDHMAPSFTRWHADNEDEAMRDD